MGLVFVWEGVGLLISGSVYAFSPTYTPWHHIAIGDAESVTPGAAAVLFSLYRVVGWTVMACGLSVILLTRHIHNENVPFHGTIRIVLGILVITPALSSFIMSFQVGWRICPWYMPALGLVLCGLAFWKTKNPIVQDQGQTKVKRG